MPPLDPITFAVVRNGFISAARDMYSTFKRTALLPILYEFNDFGMSLYDARLNILADAPGIPVFVGSLDVCIERTLEEIGGRDELRPGDVLLNNHPYLTAGQTADAAVIEPIFADGGLIGFSALRGHMGDFGAKGPYPTDSTDLFQEGTIFPGVKLYDEGRLDRTILRILRQNSRLPSETAGSVLAGAGAVRACTEKVLALVAKYGLETYLAAVEELLDHGERVARRALERVPDGTYSFDDLLDDNGVTSEPVALACDVTVAGTEVTVDLSRSAPQQGGPVNCPWGYTLSTCRYALKRLLTPAEPANSGEYRSLRVVAPEGSIFNPRPPAPCYIGAWTSLRLGDMIVEALAPALPETVPAENGGCVVAALAYLSDPASGRLSFFFDLGGVGLGGASGQDGANALIHPVQAGCEGMPLEILETRMPVRKRRFELVRDSGGAGRFRGGVAALAEYEILGHGLLTSVSEKTRASSVKGLWGGDDAPFNNAVVLTRPGADPERLGKRADLVVGPGDVVAVRPAGGAGYGDPFERDPELVAADVLDGYVSRAAAADLYGVALDEHGRIDAGATADLRRARGEPR